ncbi:3'-5' exonuclease [Amycolatopsis halotolerans]|uniref:3'-5' exonuclease n=1 Tax=Amycolatopsis halotolerans TaxID=330083 RepID=A0ABV7QC85_9PSEU
MTGWHRGPMVAFDLETTSADPETARIVTASLVRIDPMQGSVDIENHLADPGVEIPAEATAIHGITTEQARAEGEYLPDVVLGVCGVLESAMDAGQPLVAYNASFDFTVLARELGRIGAPALVPFPVVDPYVIDKHVDRYRKGKRTLTASCEHYGVKLDQAHDSDSDALAAARLAWMLANRYPQIGEKSLRELHVAQFGWYREQQLGLADYFARQGKQETVNTEWPVRTGIEAVA